MTPDISIYREMPKWKIIENIGNSRYSGSYWQSKGKTVIPTISWAGLSTIDICTSGIEKGCVIAISNNIITVKYSRTSKIISAENIFANTDLHIGDDLYLPFESE